MSSTVTLADITAAYWFAGILTLAAVLVVVIVMLATSNSEERPKGS